MIRVGTIKYDRGKKVFPPIPPGYKRIEVMTPSTQYGSIGPYALRDEKGRIMENIWQGCKVYPKVPELDVTIPGMIVLLYGIIQRKPI